MPPPSQPPRRTTRGLTSITDVTSIASLARKAHDIAALDRQLRAAFPASMREQIRFADLRDGRLVFLAPSSAWAARVRLYQAQILEAARALGAQAHTVAVKVAPLPIEEPVPDLRKPLSPDAAHHLRTVAATLADPALRGLFLELASKAEKP